MMKRLLIVLSVVALLAIHAFPRAALAEQGRGRPGSQLPPIPGSVYGADVELTEQGVLSVGAGWPSVYGQYDFHTTGRFGIGIRTDFYYGMPVWGFNFALGWGLNAPMRIEVFERDDWNLALLLDVGLFIGFDEHWHHHLDFEHGDDALLFGPSFAVGLMASVNPVDPLNIFFGLRVPIYILIVAPEHHDTEVTSLGQVQFVAGVEFAVADNVALFTRLAFGPVVGSFCDDEDCDIKARVSGHFHFGALFFFGG